MVETTQTTAQPDPPKAERLRDDLKIYEMFRDYIKHEDGLINSRLMWILTINGFLFTAYGLTLQKKLDITYNMSTYLLAHDWIDEKYDLLHSLGLISDLYGIYVFLIVISTVGIFVSVTGLNSINRAHTALGSLRAIFHKEYPELRDCGGPRAGGCRCPTDVKILCKLGDAVRSVEFPSIAAAGVESTLLSKSSAWIRIPTILLFCWGISLFYLFVDGSNFVSLIGIEKPAIPYYNHLVLFGYTIF